MRNPDEEEYVAAVRALHDGCVSAEQRKLLQLLAYVYRGPAATQASRTFAQAIEEHLAGDRGNAEDLQRWLEEDAEAYRRRAKLARTTLGDVQRGEIFVVVGIGGELARGASIDDCTHEYLVRAYFDEAAANDHAARARIAADAAEDAAERGMATHDAVRELDPWWAPRGHSERPTLYRVEPVPIDLRRPFLGGAQEGDLASPPGPSPASKPVLPSGKIHRAVDAWLRREGADLRGRDLQSVEITIRLEPTGPETDGSCDVFVHVEHRRREQPRIQLLSSSGEELT